MGFWGFGVLGFRVQGSGFRARVKGLHDLGDVYIYVGSSDRTTGVVVFRVSCCEEELSPGTPEWD